MRIRGGSGRGNGVFVTKLRRVSAVPKMLPAVSEQFPFPKRCHFGAFRLLRGCNCGI